MEKTSLYNTDRRELEPIERTGVSSRPGSDRVPVIRKQFGSIADELNGLFAAVERLGKKIEPVMHQEATAPSVAGRLDEIQEVFVPLADDLIDIRRKIQLLSSIVTNFADRVEL